MVLEHLEPVKLAETGEEDTNLGDVLTEAQAQSGISSLQHSPITKRAPFQEQNTGFRLASGRLLLRDAGTWGGSDLEKCLTAVYTTRGQVEP